MISGILPKCKLLQVSKLSNSKNYHLNLKIREPKHQELNGSELDSEVVEETLKVRSIKQKKISEQKLVLVLRNLTKHYGKLEAVKQLCLAVGEGGCVGLLGKSLNEK